MAGELQTLIRSLQSLYTQISSQVLHNRMQGQPRSVTSRERFPIGHMLGNQIDRIAAVSERLRRAEAKEKPAASDVAAESRPSDVKVEAYEVRSGAGLLGALSKYFTRYPSSTHSQPLMQEQMRANTLYHINKALVLAREGDTKGAKVHAGLAENAMQTAGGYMTDEEYGQFCEEVEGRLQAAKGIRSLSG